MPARMRGLDHAFHPAHRRVLSGCPDLLAFFCAVDDFKPLLREAAARGEEAEKFKLKAARLRRRLQDQKVTISAKVSAEVDAMLVEYEKALEIAEEKARCMQGYARQQLERADDLERQLRAYRDADRSTST
ncbi:MAG TPA: hypothetical protein VK196_09235 [Magnetospirillum sp.]|nr:hypothetical protein [Magnetospirillum sp.]